MIITKKAISRRMVLRGTGAAIALPLLDAMVPAASALAKTAAKPVRRLGVIYIGNGAVMNSWTPAAEGTGFEFSLILKPLEPFRDHLVVVTGLENRVALSRQGEPAGGHGRISGAFLTGVHVKPTEGADFEAGISMDQIAANQLGQHTQLLSLELGVDSTGLAGTCDGGFSCTYTNTLCWRGPKTPLPMEDNPRAVFERLFGDSGSTDLTARLARMRTDRSILDAVTERAARLSGRVGPSDRAKLGQYLEAVRDIEVRIQKAQGDRELPVVDQPVGIPASYQEHVKLLFDLQVLAYQTDVTRVSSFMLARELTGRAYPESGVSDPHHALSHHEDNPEKLGRLARINAYHTHLVAHYLEKLKSTADGDGSLLDHVMVLYGGGMGNSNLHDPHNLPILLVGGGVGQIRGGRHIRCGEGTPLTNLYMTMLNKLGVPVERIGDSTGEIRAVSDL